MTADDLAQFFETYVFSQYEDIFQYLMSISHNENIADEIAQETMYKAWGILDEIEKKSSNINAYLRRMAKNLLMDYYRKERFPKLHIENQNSLDDKVLRQIIQNENLKSIHMSVNHLEFKYAQVILLFYYYDMSLRDISELTGANYNTIASRKRIALNLIASQLDPTGRIRRQEQTNPYLLPDYLLYALCRS